MTSIVEVNPFRCRMFALHDRLYEYLSEDSCKTELDSISRYGQLVPALGRPLAGDPRYDVELIYGSRRLLVSKLLNVPLKVELRELSDRAAIVAMDIENRHRKDISPYERGLSYQRWLQTKQFESQDDIAKALKISDAQVCRLLKLARLPALLVKSFASPVDICEGWGLALVDAWEDREMRPCLSQRARALLNVQKRPPAREIYRQLLAERTQEKRRSGRGHDAVVKGHDGVPLFRVRNLQRNVVLVLPKTLATAQRLEAIKHALTSALQIDDTEPPHRHSAAHLR